MIHYNIIQGNECTYLFIDKLNNLNYDFSELKSEYHLNTKEVITKENEFNRIKIEITNIENNLQKIYVPYLYLESLLINYIKKINLYFHFSEIDGIKDTYKQLEDYMKIYFDMYYSFIPMIDARASSLAILHIQRRKKANLEIPSEIEIFGKDLLKTNIIEIMYYLMDNEYVDSVTVKTLNNFNSIKVKPKKIINCFFPGFILMQVVKVIVYSLFIEKGAVKK